MPLLSDLFYPISIWRGVQFGVFVSRSLLYPLPLFFTQFGGLVPVRVDWYVISYPRYNIPFKAGVFCCCRGVRHRTEHWTELSHFNPTTVEALSGVFGGVLSSTLPTFGFIRLEGPKRAVVPWETKG